MPESKMSQQHNLSCLVCKTSSPGSNPRGIITTPRHPAAEAMRTKMVDGSGEPAVLAAAGKVLALRQTNGRLVKPFQFTSMEAEASSCYGVPAIEIVLMRRLLFSCDS